MPTAILPGGYNSGERDKISQFCSAGPQPVSILSDILAPTSIEARQPPEEPIYVPIFPRGDQKLIKADGMGLDAKTVSLLKSRNGRKS